MSIYAVERALFDAANNPVQGALFGENPDAFLANYALSEQERQQIKTLDVKALGAQGASYMLLMMFWVAANRGLDSMPQYVQRLNS